MEVASLCAVMDTLADQDALFLVRERSLFMAVGGVVNQGGGKNFATYCRGGGGGGQLFFSIVKTLC